MQPWGGGPSSSDGRSLEGLFSLMPLAGSPGCILAVGAERESPQGPRSHPGAHNLCPLPSFMPTALPCNVVTHGWELLCPHSLGLRKCLWNELLIGKCFYPRSCMPGRASLWPRLTGTTHILHTPSLPPSLPPFPHPQPWGPLPSSFSPFWGRGGGNSRAQAHLPSRFPVHNSVSTLGAELRSPLCTSEGHFLFTQGAWPQWRGTVNSTPLGFCLLLGLSLSSAYPNPHVLGGPAHVPFDPLLRNGSFAYLHVGAIPSTWNLIAAPLTPGAHCLILSGCNPFPSSMSPFHLSDL